MSKRQKSRGNVINPYLVFTTNSSIPGIVDCSFEAYKSKDPHFTTTLCRCDSEYCCHLHYYDFSSNYTAGCSDK